MRSERDDDERSSEERRSRDSLLVDAAHASLLEASSFGPLPDPALIWLRAKLAEERRAARRALLAIDVVTALSVLVAVGAIVGAAFSIGSDIVAILSRLGETTRLPSRLLMPSFLVAVSIILVPALSILLDSWTEAS